MINAARISLDAMPLHRDTHLPVDYSGRLIAEAVLCRLFTEDGPGCATEAECLDDGRRWSVRLDPARRWSDGRILNAQDVAAAVPHALNHHSQGAAIFLSAEDGGGPPVRVADGDSVEFRFDRPVGFAPAFLSLPAFAPRRTGTDGAGRAVSLGGHLVSRWDTDRVELARNPWADLPPGSPDEVHYVHLPRAADAVRGFLAGELDATSPTGLGVAEVAALRGHAVAVSTPIGILGTLDLGRRAPRAWLASADARRCVSAVLDRARLESVAAGLAEPWRWPGAEPLGAGAPHGAADDAATAAQAARGVDGPLDIAYSAFDPNAEIAAELANQLGRTLGVEVNTTRLSFAQYVHAVGSHDHCMLYSLTTPAFAHPAGSLSDWRSTGRAARRGGLADPVLDRALDAAEGCLDPAAASALWVRVADRWCELMPRIPLVRIRAFYLRGGRLPGLSVNRAGLMSFTSG
jgi:ABC-type transport system substrate-binding protein